LERATLGRKEVLQSDEAEPHLPEKGAVPGREGGRKSRDDKRSESKIEKK